MNAFFLADDLSGALDAAGAFHRVGQQVVIVLDPSAWPPARARCVVGFTTETRNATPAEAAAAVNDAVRLGRSRGGQLVYKKIDSTLRGPVAAELEALAAALPAVNILFAPANPAVGRTVRDGRLLVQGVPVAETEYARDPVSPVRHSIIADLLGPGRSHRIVIPDTETAGDLATAVQRIVSRGESWVGVGSGALARPVAEAVFGPAGSQAAASPRVSAASPGQALFLCGSAHPRNREQAAALARERGVALVELGVTASDRVPDLHRRLGKGDSMALLIEQARSDSRAIVARLAAIAAAAVRSDGVRRMFVTGGETAFAVCRELGITALQFEREVESGLCVARGNIPAEGDVWLAIKPGGFGDTLTWVRAFDALAP